jgi:hypothetical protein
MLNIIDGYELYFEFGKINYNGNIAFLNQTYFYGAALKRAKKLNEKDSIKLDFSQQHQIFIPNSFYIATLSWQGLRYGQDDIIELFNCQLEHEKVGTLKNLTPEEFFIIDTYKHEERVHAKNLVYNAYILNSEGFPLGLEVDLKNA